jgi:hypothetical protein
MMTLEISMKHIVWVLVLLFVVSACELAKDTGDAIGTAADNIGDSSRKIAKDVGDAGNAAIENIKSGGEEE